MMQSENRPDPDALLERLAGKEQAGKGRLKIFFGYAAGVGKTYAMLEEAREQYRNGVDVLVGYVEPHARPETLRLADGLPALEPKKISYRSIALREFDVDAALRRKPELVLVDELAHSNAEGLRNKKRYQDIEELLSAGIDVYTTLNVQHIESLNDVVQRITGITVQETVPDYIVDRADNVKLIDIDPEELLKRFGEGKVYKKERAAVARENFFTLGNLSSLREIAMRKAADRISRNAPPDGEAAGEKILVCVGPSPSSAGCIRAGARMAEAWHAPWIVVTVMQDDRGEGIRNNAALAERLGARVVSLRGGDIALTISEYAKITGITSIIIGKRKRQDVIRNPFKTEFADRLSSLLPSVEIHIIPDSTIRERYKKDKQRFSADEKRKPISFRELCISLLVLILTTGLSFLLRVIDLGEHNIILVYILGVLAVSRFSEGYLNGALSSVLAVLCFNFFFTEPYFTLDAIRPEYPVTFLIMFLVALMTSALTIRIKEQAHAAVLRERRTEMLYEINKKLLETRGEGNIRQVITDHIAAIFQRASVVYTADPSVSDAAAFRTGMALYGNEAAPVHWVFVNGKPAGPGTGTLETAQAYYLPVAGHDRVLGVIGVSCANGFPLTHDNTVFLGMIASLAALALERQILSDTQHRMRVEAEKERLRNDFLRGISHDLRTPLTAILGASSALLENGDLLDPDSRRTLAADIRYDAQWLIRMVENVLSVTRISEGTMRIVKKPEAVEEVVAEAVHLVKAHVGNVNLSVSVPDELLVVPMDGTLVEQVLINLIENAVKYAGEEPLIELQVTADAAKVTFEVSDDGRGIPEESFPHLFNGLLYGNRQAGDSSRGLGLGLVICSAAVKAHNGTIDARNRGTGGAVFRFTLPRDPGVRDGEQAAGSDR